jgi:hypothetical protein
VATHSRGLYPLFLNWKILRRSRFDGLLSGAGEKLFISFRSSASFFRRSWLASVSE